MRIILAVLLFPLLFVGTAGAADQESINEQLKQGGVVHLPAGTYTLTDSIVLKSNCVLEGEPGTIITIPDGSHWQAWKPLIIGESVHNVTIRDLEINANSDGQTEPHGKGYYNCIHVIDCDSVNVYNCTFHDSLGDGLRTKTCTNIEFYNNLEYRLGHEGAFFIDTQNVEAYNNRITTRTNSALRIWNSAHIRFYHNVIDAQLDSLGGNPGIQIEDSKGSMQDIEISDNILTQTWGAGIWLISYDQGVSNTQGILIHHNLFWQVGQSYNIPYTGGVINDGCKGTQLYNNCFDGVRNDALRNQKGGFGTTIHDNIITDTVPHAAISQKGTGYGIADLEDAGLTIYNNCFYNNHEGDCYQCNSTGNDLQDPKTHQTSSGWTWTGSTWTCEEVPPLVLGQIAPTNTSGTVDHDTHEIVFNDIFDILNVEFSDTGNSTSDQVNPEIQWQEKGMSKAWVDIVGWNNTIEQNGIFYIPAEEQPIVKFSAVNTAPLPVSTDTALTFTENNGTVTADLKVTSVYAVTEKKTKLVNGKPVSSIGFVRKSQVSHYYATESLPRAYSPAINTTAYVTILNNTISPQTRVFVPENSDVMKVIFENNDTKTIHYLHTGILNTTDKGVNYIQISNLDYWDNNVTRLGSSWIIPSALDPKTVDSQIKITQYDFYGGEIPINDFKIEVQNIDEKNLISPLTILFSGIVGIFAYGTYKIIQVIL